MAVTEQILGSSVSQELASQDQIQDPLIYLFPHLPPVTLSEARDIWEWSWNKSLQEKDLGEKGSRKLEVPLPVVQSADNNLLQTSGIIYLPNLSYADLWTLQALPRSMKFPDAGLAFTDEQRSQDLPRINAIRGGWFVGDTGITPLYLDQSQTAIKKQFNEGKMDGMALPHYFAANELLKHLYEAMSARFGVNSRSASFLDYPTGEERFKSSLPGSRYTVSGGGVVASTIVGSDVVSFTELVKKYSDMGDSVAGYLDKVKEANLDGVTEGTGAEHILIPVPKTIYREVPNFIRENVLGGRFVKRL